MCRAKPFLALASGTTIPPAAVRHHPFLLPRPGRRPRSDDATFLAFVAVAIVSALHPQLAGAQEGPPATRTVPVVDTLYGDTVPDPWRWLEDGDSEELLAWFRAQGAYARSVLDTLSVRAAFLDRMRTIAAAAPPEISLPREAGGRSFYTLRRAGEPVARGYVRDAWTGEERPLVDPAAVRGGEEGPSTLAIFRPSPDGRLVLYGVTSGGSENVVLRVRDVASGRDVAGPIERTAPWDPFDPWSPDGRSFFYLQFRDLPYRGGRIFRHRMGDELGSDISVFSGTMVGEDDGLLPFLEVDARNGLAIGLLRTGVEQHSAFFVTSADELAAEVPKWRPLFTLADSVVSVAARGPDLYVLTWKGTPRIVHTALDAPDLETGKVVMAGGEDRMQWMRVALDGLYVDRFAEGINRVTRIPWGESPTPIELPAGTSVYQPPGAFTSEIRANPLRSGVLLTLASWTAVPRPFRYSPATDTLEEVPLRPPGPYDRFDGHVVETVHAPSHDGTRVPLTIIRPRRLDREGSLPVLLIGYGAYGFPNDPFHVAEWRPWYEAGGADAICHVRGGGYYGTAWHAAGRKTTKPNTWLDFIACAEHLIREGYTRPERLVALGVSAGGIAVGRAITERPDLFAGAVIQNGVLDAVRFETTPGGSAHTHEFGSVATGEGFRALHAMSAVHHVRPGTAYPAVLLAVGLNDPRVAPWQSAKMAAALQTATTSGRAVLLRVDEAAGHMPQEETAEQLRQLAADIYAFVMAQAGTPAYRSPVR